MSSRVKSWLCLFVACVGLAVIGLAKPIAAQMINPHASAAMLRSEARESAPGSDRSALRGVRGVRDSESATLVAAELEVTALTRQLEALTSFYELVITLMLGALALVGAFGLWSVNFVSQAKAEAIARSVLKEDWFKNSVKQETAQLVAASDRSEEIETLRSQIDLIWEQLDLDIYGEDDGDRAGDPQGTGGAG